MMKYSDAFTRNIQDTFGTSGEVWLQSLPSLISELERKWNWQFLIPAQDLSYNFVGFGKRNQDDKEVVIKILCPDGVLEKELQWFQFYPDVTPEILGHDSRIKAFLMEKVRPGDSLKSLVRQGKDAEATRVLAKVILRLGKPVDAVPKPFRHVREFIPTLEKLHGKVPTELVHLSAFLFQDLCMTAPQDVLLHGDLHHDNILSSGDSWTVIDPHGYVGDPAFEVGAMINNPLDFYPQGDMQGILETRLQILSEELPWDGQRILSWCFCYSMLSAAWSVEDRQEIPENLLRIIWILGQKLS
ncbi:phosphotransferase [Bdellovibrio bacteriovorus]|uniref:aminoglycoside phosphotransferase family protein n=1 Tax=Bdellovibrio bacteriovorus TaxID=959 RepID=UPI0021CE10AF|nr:aminoglycoside phosphotransferase family protein [Bdellovibrio bacteriovorus]UXR65460.1 phosphotransferase [Bdellovibrio bacteriovorus]